MLTATRPSPPKIKRLTKTVNEEIVNRAIRHATYIERLKTSEVNKIVGLLNDHVLGDITASLDQRLRNIAKRGYDTGPETTARLRQLLASTDATIQAGAEMVTGVLAKDLGSIAISEAQFQLAMLTDAVPLAWDFVTPSPVLLRSIVSSRPFEGKLLKDWFGDLATGTQTRLQQQLNIGLTRGESVGQLVSRVAEKGGLADQVRYQTEAVVRTATNHVTSQAREITYDENKDIVDQVQFVATLDGRTTPQCRALDGKVFEVGKGPRPPLHFNCRSTTVPIVKSWKELGFDLQDVPLTTRASMNGQVAASLSYGDWLKQQPKTFVEETLGPGKAKLFLDDKVPIDRFVDNKYKPLTIEEIRKREGL